MPNPSAIPPLPRLERQWLRRYGWLLALLGLLAGLIVGPYCWAAVLLDANFAPPGWPLPLSRAGLALGLGLAFLPVFWWLGLHLESQHQVISRRWPVAPLLAMLAVFVVEATFRVYPSQCLFWQAVRARSGHQHMAREISLLREAAAADANRGDQLAPGLVLLGSSQIVYGIDPEGLAAQTGEPIYRRAVAGLFLSELVASQDFADFQPGNRLVMMLSGFDLGARDDLYGDAMRPIATPRGLSHLLKAAPPNLLLSRWRTWIDMAFAATCDLWRSRDYSRFLLQNPFAASVQPTAARQSEDLKAQKTAYTALGRNPQMVALCRESLRRFFKDMSGRCRQIVVFEAQVNPAFPDPNYTVLSADMRQFLQDQQARGLIRYVPVAEQQVDLPESAWLDMTHLNESGRKIYTAMFARILGEKSPAP